MNKKQYQSGSAHLAVIVVLVLALLGSVGFIFYQNFIQDKDGVSKIDGTNIQDNDYTPKIDDTEKIDNTEQVVSYEGYLVLDDWDVKFKLPADLGDNVVTYKKVTVDSGVYYGISTERVSALGGNCDELVGFVRSEEPNNGAVGSPIPAGQVDGYYYGIQSPQSACSELAMDNVTHKNIVYPDLIMLKALLATVEKK